MFEDFEITIQSITSTTVNGDTNSGSLANDNVTVRYKGETLTSVFDAKGIVDQLAQLIAIKPTPTPNALITAGTALFDALFTRSVYVRYSMALREAQTEGHTLRLHIHTRNHHQYQAARFHSANPTLGATRHAVRA